MCGQEAHGRIGMRTVLVVSQFIHGKISTGGWIDFPLASSRRSVCNLQNTILSSFNILVAVEYIEYQEFFLSGIL